MIVTVVAEIAREVTANAAVTNQSAPLSRVVVIVNAVAAVDVIAIATVIVIGTVTVIAIAISKIADLSLLSHLQGRIQKAFLLK
jgi:hypothetical protein